MITRYNYEEYFLLYVDNELSAAEKHAVDEFILQNPDLEEELTMLKQSVIKPEHDISFSDKHALLIRSGEDSLIAPHNYEEFFLLYVDNELDVLTRKQVEDFVSKNPVLQNEFNLLQQAKLEPDADIRFEGREGLYRESRRIRIIPLQWVGAAAAVRILLVTGFLFFYKNSDAVKQSQIHTSVSAVAKRIDSPGRKASSGIIKESLAVTTDSIGSFNNAEGTRAETLKKRHSQEGIVVVKIRKKNIKDDEGNSYVGATNISSNHVSPQLQDSFADNVTRAIVDSRISKSTRSAGTNLNDAPKEIIVKVDQTNNQASENETYDKMVASNDNNDEGSDTYNPSAKKNKLRGIFRRVSRVFEKATNVDDTDKHSVAIGNIQVALK